MNTKQKNIVGLKELRENMDVYIKRVHNGEAITVFRRSTPLFKLTPVDTEDVWETVIDFTELDPKGVPAKDVIAALKEMHG